MVSLEFETMEAQNETMWIKSETLATENETIVRRMKPSPQQVKPTPQKRKQKTQLHGYQKMRDPFFENVRKTDLIHKRFHLKMKP